MLGANGLIRSACLPLLSMALAMPATAEIVPSKPVPAKQIMAVTQAVTIEESAAAASKAYRSLHMGIAKPAVLPSCPGQRGAPVRIVLSNVLEDIAHPRHSVSRAIKRGATGSNPDNDSIYTTPVDRPTSAGIPISTNLDMQLLETPNRTGYTPIRIVLRKSNGIQFMTPAAEAIIPYAWSTATFCGPVTITDAGRRWILKFGVVDAPGTVGGFNIGLLVPDWASEDDPTDVEGKVPTYWMPLYLDPAVKNVG